MKIVVCGYFGIRNIGDEAILMGLRRLLLRIKPMCEIEVMGHGKLFPFGIRSFLRSLFVWRRWQAPYRLVKSCDYFIMSGGLFTDEEGIFVSTFWLLHGLTAHFFKRPVLLLGISIGRLSLWNKWLCKKLYKASKLIVVRDKASFEKLDSWGIKSHLGSDISGFIEYKKEGISEKEKYVVICVRPYRKTPEFLYTNIAQFCNALIEKYGFNIRLIPFHEGPESDSKVLNTIFEHIKEKSKVQIDNFYGHIPDLMDVLSKASFVFGMRLHAGILATLVGTPFIGISYMEKVGNFWHETAIKALSQDQISVDNLLQEFQNIYNSDREHRLLIKNIQEFFIEKAKKTEEILASTLQN